MKFHFINYLRNHISFIPLFNYQKPTVILIFKGITTLEGFMRSYWNIKEDTWKAMFIINNGLRSPWLRIPIYWFMDVNHLQGCSLIKHMNCDSFWNYLPISIIKVENVRIYTKKRYSLSPKPLHLMKKKYPMKHHYP